MLFCLRILKENAKNGVGKLNPGIFESPWHCGIPGLKALFSDASPKGT
jgi:hypothetical protein